MGLRRFARRRKKDGELSEEIASHLAHAQDANAARGLAPEEARRQARIRFGSPDALRERIWRYRSGPLLGWLEAVWRDLRFATRSLGKTPGFLVTAVLVMAVGIGVNTAVFSVVDTVLLSRSATPIPKPWCSLRTRARKACLWVRMCRSLTFGDSRALSLKQSRATTWAARV